MRLSPKYRVHQASPDGGDPAGGGGGNPAGNESDWKATLPDDLREDAALQDFKDVGSLAKSYLATKAQVGNSLRAPGEDATPEAVAEFYEKAVKLSNGKLMPAPDLTDETATKELYKALGVPDEASAYELPDVEGAPELPPERIGFLKGLAHKYGMTQKNFSGFMQEALQADASALGAQEQARQDGIGELRGEWGETFDTRVAQAKTVAEKTGAPDSLKQALNDNQAGADVIRWLHTLAESLGSEANEIHKQQGGADDLVDKQEASLRANEIRSKLSTMTPGHPDYDVLLKKLVAYEEKAG